LKQFYKFNDDTVFKVFVMEKPQVNCLEDKTKDGIHIIVGLNMPKEFRCDYRRAILKRLQDCLTHLPLINTWEEVVDEGILKATTNWQLYGSKKPNHDAYKLTKQFKIGYDGRDGEFTYEDEPIPIQIDFNLLKELSVQNLERPNIETKPLPVVKPTLPLNTNTKPLNIPDEQLFQYCDKISLKYLDCYSDWIKIMMALKKDENNKSIAEHITKKSKHFNEANFQE
jgi:hypothetical protein